MDWTPWIGRRRPVEEDARRILLVVHQLGEPAALPAVAGERRLQTYDHLVRHPVDLAFAVIDRYAGAERRRRRPAVAREVRRLLPAGRTPRRPWDERLRRFHLRPWERWDDVCAHLGCRNLLRVRPRRSAPGEVAYELTAEGAAYCRRAERSQGGLKPLVERCRTLEKHLLGGDRGGALEERLAEVDRRIERFRRDEHVGSEDDLLSRFFRHAFGERL